MPKKKRVVILGSTGSIGTSALKVARDIPDRMEVVALAANRRLDDLLEQAQATGAGHLCLSDEAQFGALKARAPTGVMTYAGEDGLCELAQFPEADIVLIAIVGTAGLKPALAAIEAGKDIAVASKEILVMAGETVMAAAQGGESPSRGQRAQCHLPVS